MESKTAAERLSLIARYSAQLHDALQNGEHDKAQRLNERIYDLAAKVK